MKIDVKYERGFFENIENTECLLYTDTDSMYILAQNKKPELHGDDLKDLFLDDKSDTSQWGKMIDQANILASDINDIINDEMINVIGKYANLDPEYQSIFFKTEMIALRMLQFNVKKTYALTYVYDEGKVLTEPAMKKVGGQIKKSNTPIISKEILVDIYDTILYSEVKSVSELATIIFKNMFNKYKKKFQVAFKQVNFDYIGLPQKYGFGKNMTKWIWGAKFFNTFINDELRPGSSMKSLYIRYNQNKLRQLLEKNKASEYTLDASDVNLKWDMISVPIEISSEVYEKYKDKFEYLAKEIDLEFSFDHNFDICVIKKFDQFKTFFE